MGICWCGRYVKRGKSKGGWVRMRAILMFILAQVGGDGEK